VKLARTGEAAAPPVHLQLEREQAERRPASRESEKSMFTSHECQGNTLVVNWALNAYRCLMAAGRA